MRVLLLSTYGKGGGAAIAAKRLLKSLNIQNIQAQMLVKSGDKAEDKIFPLYPKPIQQPLFLLDKFLEKILFLNQEKDKSVRFAFSTASTGTNISHHPLVKKADVIHLHWVQHGFLSIQNLKQLADTGKPIVWTMHDQWAFTGGCHYTRGCRHFEDKCGNCPMLRKPASSDLSQKLWNQKFEVFNTTKHICLVACSEWLKNEAQASRMLKNCRVEAIPNPIDLSLFRPEDSKNARQKLGIKPDKFVLLFVAQNIQDPRKGFQYLERAIQKLSPDIQSKLCLLLMGKDSPENLPIESIPTGSLQEVALIRQAYAAANVLVTPSLEDNLPNTIMEAMACGKPVIAFKTGGIPEMIQHKKNGWLAEPGYEQGLSEGITWLAQNNHAEEYGLNALHFAQQEYAPNRIANSYIQLYKSLLSN